MDAIFPYVESEQVFNCPSQSFTAPAGPYKFRHGSNYGSYAINSSYYYEKDFEQSPAGEPNTTLSALVDASGTLWIGDGNGYFEFAWSSAQGDPDDNVIQPNVEVDGSGLRYLDNLVERHLNTIPVLFCDGHVKSVKLDSLTRKNAAGAYPVFTIQDDNS